MIIWTLFLILFISLSSWFPFLDIFHISTELHNLCLEKLNFNTPLSEIYKALICGKKLPNSPTKELFLKGGLIHLTVISGAHLLFLERFWKKIPLPIFLKTHGLFFVLILYALASQLHPPVVRALFSFFLFQLSRSLKLFWSPNLITCFSAILCLIYKPLWVFSFSLQISLLACFLQRISTSSIKKAFFIYLFILPVINRWQDLHPLTVLINWIFAPVISSLLFPLSFLSPFIPKMYILTDFLWTLFLKVLKLVDFFPSKSPLMNWSIPEDWMWFYISFVCLIIFVTNYFKKIYWLYPKKQTELCLYSD